MASEIKTPPIHSKRVQAWVYAVINPLIENLQREVFLLRKKDISWRFYSKRCEDIRPIREYIESSQMPNFDDFVSDKLNPEFRPDFDRHDQQVDTVESCANRFFDDLMQTSLFLEQVKKSLEEYESRASAHPPHTGLDSMKEDLPKYVAEFIVNQTKLLPNHYVTHQFWKDFGRNFIERSADEFQGYQQRQSFQALRNATDNLRDTSDKLSTHLENHRRFLCTTYDIPAAPIFVDHRPSADVLTD